MTPEEYNKSLFEVTKFSTTEFEKSIIFISSGAFIVSFVFIKDLIPNLKEAVNKAYLISSWKFFAIVIFISLLAHFVSMMGSSWAASNNDKLDDGLYNERVDLWNLVIRILNISMIILISFGGMLLIQFVNQNL